MKLFANPVSKHICNKNKNMHAEIFDEENKFTAVHSVKEEIYGTTCINGVTLALLALCPSIMTKHESLHVFLTLKPFKFDIMSIKLQS